MKEYLIQVYKDSSDFERTDIIDRSLNANNDKDAHEEAERILKFHSGRAVKLYKLVDSFEKKLSDDEKGKELED